MGNDSFFTKMSPHLWPFLLPLLRPMSFDVGETVCVQGEDASDMYVVLSGVLACSNSIPAESEPRVRHAHTGDTVNLLHVLVVWSKCVETVAVKAQTETYAISQEDFRGLYTTETDVEEFNSMRKREVRSYHMEDAGSAGSSDLGRPVCFTCFSSVVLTLNQVRLPNLASIVEARASNTTTSPSRRPSLRESMSLSFDNVSALNMQVGPNLGQTWAIADLIDCTSGKSLGDIWRRKTEKVPIKFLSKADSDGGLAFWDEVIHWDDISVPFDNVGIRIRIYVDAVAQGSACKDQSDLLVGRGLVALADWEGKQKEEAAAKQKAINKFERKSSMAKSTFVSSSYGRAEVEQQLEEWLFLDEPFMSNGNRQNRSRTNSLSSFPQSGRERSMSARSLQAAGGGWSSIRAAVFQSTGKAKDQERPAEPAAFGEVNILLCAQRPWRPRRARQKAKTLKSESSTAATKKAAFPRVDERMSSIKETSMELDSPPPHADGPGVELANLPTARVRNRPRISFDEPAKASVDDDADPGADCESGSSFHDIFH